MKHRQVTRRLALRAPLLCYTTDQQRHYISGRCAVYTGVYVITNTLAKLVGALQSGWRSANALGLFTWNVVHCAQCTSCAHRTDA